MKNLSKVLAVVLAFAMALSMVSFAGYTDVAAEDNCAEAVSVLSSLEILKGYEDGSFKPDATITRAEFATVVIRVLGLANSATGGSTIFTDVAADHWANGAIALAAQQGIVNGYGNGKFGPEDPVKYEEAIKMVVAALGYTPMADANGGYPGGYQVVAAQKGILDDISGAKVGQPATRGVVAMLAYNSLDVPLMEQTGFGTQTNFQTVSALTLSKLGVTKFRGEITGTNASGATKAGKVSVKYNQQYVGVKGESLAYTPNVPNALYNTVASATATIAATGDVEATAKELLDVASILYVKDAGTTDATLVAIVKDGNRNQTVEFKASDIKTAITLDGTADDPVLALEVWTDADAGEYEKYKILDPSAKLYVNGRAVAAGSVVSTFNSKVAAANTNVEVKLLATGADEDVFNKVYITEWVDVVVDTISERTWKVIDKSGTTYILDETADDQAFVIYKDGEVASFADIKENDVLSIAGYRNAGTRKLEYGDVYITSEQVTGKVTGTTSSKIYIDGEAYVKGVGLGATTIGDSYTFYVNSRDELVGLDKTESAANVKYGFASWIYADKNFGDAKIRLLTSDNTWATVDLASKITMLTGANTVGKVNTSEVNWASAVGVAGNISGTTKYAVNNVVAYEINDAGEIDVLYLAPYTVGVPNEAVFQANYSNNNSNVDQTYKEAVDRIGGLSIDTDTVIFSYNFANLTGQSYDMGNAIDESAYGALFEILSSQESNVVVVTTSTLVDRTNFDIDYGYNMDTDTNVFPVLLGNNIAAGIDWTSNFFVVSDVPMTTTDADGDTGVLLTGLVNGETKTLFIDSTDTTKYKANYAYNTEITTSALDVTIAKGDVLIYSLAANGEEAEEVILLLDASATQSVNANYGELDNIPLAGETAGADATLGYKTIAGDKYHFIFGYVKEKSGSSVTLVGGDDSTATPYRFNADTVGANFNAFIGNNGGIVSEASYGDAEQDKGYGTGSANNDADFIFARVANDIVVEDFVIITNKRG